ncbi:Zn-ribbon domain-containing OB-fold protein [Pollutimonas bauzanensis]|uniref:Uncharacterized protein n=1 Tax=Pollutimonas bauzanensis TaxID=658167 RepID=A0A1M5R2B4_9BURK|nr:OB-fold domain-containing protein [Pollutimonas bauzanensis]SHH20512.1 hypothetical protein SAMN04488135_102452 [Pollutimonas bauzanensis]
MTSIPYDKPLPVLDPLTKPYWDFAWARQLSVQRCQSCGDRHFPACEVCPVCLSDDQLWEVVSGRATLVSWVRFHRAYWDGYRAELPYDVCLVQLEEGPLVLSNFGCDIPDDVHMGLPMRAVFEHVAESVSLLRFVPA